MSLSKPSGFTCFFLENRQKNIQIFQMSMKSANSRVWNALDQMVQIFQVINCKDKGMELKPVDSRDLKLYQVKKKEKLGKATMPRNVLLVKKV